MLTRLTGKWEGKRVGSVTTLTCQLFQSTDLGQPYPRNGKNTQDLLLGFGRISPLVGGMISASTIKHALIRADRPLAASE